MRWDELVDFVKGTRPRPPPGPKRPVATVLLVMAALLHLPLVYALVASIDLQPAFTLAVGLIAIGLAWGGGVSLEGRRQGTVRIITALALGESALAFVPFLADALGVYRWLFVAIGVLALGALVALLRDE